MGKSLFYASLLCFVVALGVYALGGAWQIFAVIGFLLFFIAKLLPK